MLWKRAGVRRGSTASGRSVVGVESRAAVPHFLPGEVQKGGVVAPHPADTVAVEQPCQGSQPVLVQLVLLKGQRTHVAERYRIRLEIHHKVEFIK